MKKNTLLLVYFMGFELLDETQLCIYIFFLLSRLSLYFKRFNTLLYFQYIYDLVWFFFLLQILLVATCILLTSNAAVRADDDDLSMTYHVSSDRIVQVNRLIKNFYFSIFSKTPQSCCSINKSDVSARYIPRFPNATDMNTTSVYLSVNGIRTVFGKKWIESRMTCQEVTFLLLSK